MNKTPVAVPVNNDYILDNLTLAIVGNGPSASNLPSPEALRMPELSLAFGVTATPKLRAITKAESNDQRQSGGRYSNRANIQPVKSVSQPLTNVQPPTEVETKPSLAQQALDLRVRLGGLTRWTGAKSQEAINLSNSIEVALERLNPQLPAEFGRQCAVVLQLNTYRNIPHAFREEVELDVIKVSDRWKVNDAQLEALLSLVSYSSWVAEQNKRKREETDREKSLTRLDSSGHRIREQNIEDSRSIGWLRAKAPESQICHKIIGRSSPNLLCDLSWWTPDAEWVLDKVKHVGTPERNMVAVREINPWVVGPGLKPDKAIERHALGFYVNNVALDSAGTVLIQLLMLTALTYPDTFWSSECTEGQAFALHLFSTFMWATMEYVESASQFHPITVTRPGEQLFGSPLVEEHSKYIPIIQPFQLKSDEIEALVQELQKTELGTFEEIYRTVIPPLSHFGRLPNEAVADWRNKDLIKQEVSLNWQDVSLATLH